MYFQGSPKVLQLLSSFGYLMPILQSTFKGSQMNTCANCKHLIYEYHQIHSDFPTTELEKACDVRNGVGNLKQFPFKNTSCNKFEPTIRK
jgi:hypothetical protein